MKFRILGGVIFFGLTVALGFYLGSQSWNGVIYIANTDLAVNPRSPAAIKRELDFSRLDGADLISATQQRLVSAAKIVVGPQGSGDVGLEFGHFVVRDEQGQRRLACDAHYDRIQLNFEAEGVAEAGEKPVMEIDGPCRTSYSDIMSIEPIWIPVGKLLSEQPVDMDISYDENVKFKFSHLSSSWPLRWSLQSVRLYSADEAIQEVKISASDLREIRPTPIVLKWNGRLPARQ